MHFVTLDTKIYYIKVQYLKIYFNNVIKWTGSNKKFDENAEELFDESTNELMECLSAAERFEEDAKFFDRLYFYYQNMENINGKRTREESREREKYRRFDLEKCTWYEWYKVPPNDSVYDEARPKASFSFDCNDCSLTFNF